jgi:hypothetical protein
LNPEEFTILVDRLLDFERPKAKARMKSGKSQNGAGGGRGKKNPGTKEPRVSGDGKRALLEV